MTGLDPNHDQIIQIACFVTDYELNLLEEKGFEIVVHQPKELLDRMDEWCTQTHARTGLTPKVLESKTEPEDAAAALLDYVKRFVPHAGKAVLAGNSVYHDKEFLQRGPYLSIIQHLHHRILDVSAIKEGVRRWCSKGFLQCIPQKKSTHEARQDILESIEEAKFYQNGLFRCATVDKP